MLDLQPILSCRSHLCHGRRRHVEADEDRQRSAIGTSERRLALQGRYLGSLVIRFRMVEACLVDIRAVYLNVDEMPARREGA